jgi:hypothetical protein
MGKVESEALQWGRMICLYAVDDTTVGNLDAPRPQS